MNELASQLEIIKHGVALAPISASGYESFARSFLRISGPDAARWLNGMVTNNIKDLAPGEGNYNFLLNAQGRILGDCTIYCEPGSGDPIFLLETYRSQFSAIQQHMEKFIIMDDVELTPGPSNWHPLLVLGPQSPTVLHDYYATNKGEDFSTLPPLRIGHHSEGSSDVVTPEPTSVPRFELLDATASQLERATTITVSTASPETLEAYRILSGIPRYGTDIRNTDTAKDLPQETAQTHALNFNKGCYLGQEIVERIHSRGQVHRTFTRFTLTGALPTLPAPLTSDGKLAGELTSAIQIGDTLHALGYLRREFLTAPLTYPGGTAQLASGIWNTGN